MPLTHGLQAIRGIFDGESTAAVLALISKEALVGAVYGLLGYVIFRSTERLAMAGATLELYQHHDGGSVRGKTTSRFRS